MDIEAALNEIIIRYGHEIVYIRRNLRFHCECFSNRNGQADVKCKKCLGTGYAISYERMRVRNRLVDGHGTLSEQGETLSPKGLKEIKNSVYYFLKRYHPKAGDLILEVEWDDKGKVVRILDKRIIAIADPKLGLEGRTEFYQVHCKFEEGRESDAQTIASSTIPPDATQL